MTNQDDFDEEYSAELYQSWLAYQEFLGREYNDVFYNTPIYSRSDISLAIQYASNSITIEPTEIGKNVYAELYNEKILEYLNNVN